MGRQNEVGLQDGRDHVSGVAFTLCYRLCSWRDTPSVHFMKLFYSLTTGHDDGPICNVLLQ